MKIPSLQRLRELDDLGLITVRPLDDLLIANYTPRCAFGSAWDDDTLACRGLILRVDQPWPASTRVVDVAARPFDKFFNLGEGGRAPASALVEATEKLDGSLGILFRQGGAFHIATRGSFQSEQALWASEFVRRYDLRALPDNLTLLFEIIYPDNRIVVDYGAREDLVLLGVIDRFTGQDYFAADVAGLAAEFGFGQPATYAEITSIEAALERAETLNHSMEGWVLRFADGTRFKVKGRAYQQVHRLINNVTPRRVVESLIDGTLNDWLVMLPEEFRADVERWRDGAEQEVAQAQIRLQAALAVAPRTSRKDFALWVQANQRADAPYLFSLLDGRDVRLALLKQLMESSWGASASGVPNRISDEE